MSNHSALNPVGPHAAMIEQLWWLFFNVSVVVYVLVIAALIYALLRPRRRMSDAKAGGEPAAQPRHVELTGGEPSEEQPGDARSRLIVGAAVGVSVLVLIVLAVSDFLVGRALAQDVSDPLRIRITGHQWWWNIEYEDPVPSNRLRTANELHVPVGRAVQLTLTSNDVIHSFWLPNIDGKKDLIPGHITGEIFVVERPGVYEGQCAEFCGHQHAKMRLIVRAQTPEEFEAWKRQQLQPSRQPTTAEQERGKQVFENSSCALCHSIQGTTAGATVAPDLTHLASRRTIAAGTLPNEPGYLAGWILNPHHIKPGVRMPSNSLPPQDLPPLLSYLESLQ